MNWLSQARQLRLSHVSSIVNFMWLRCFGYVCFLQLWYWQCFQPDEWKGSDQHIVPTVNQLRMAKNARTIVFRGGSSREWLQIGTPCELCALGDELKHNYWSKLQDDVKIVWFEGIIICLCCCVMILVNLCYNGLSMMYVEVAHTKQPREPCNVPTLMFNVCTTLAICEALHHLWARVWWRKYWEAGVDRPYPLWWQDFRSGFLASSS